jgi:uncharacterized protein
MSKMNPIITDRNFIQTKAEQKLDENDAFRSYLQKIDSDALDKTVHAINEKITPQIDCTTCGGCCRQLMINVTPEENIKVAAHLNITPQAFKEKYLEESLQGKMIMNTIPCHFLADSKCTVYENRFTECRAFPHLHENNFKGRLFGTLIHYAMCPIIYNVVEELKVETGFVVSHEE